MQQPLTILPNFNRATVRVLPYPTLATALVQVNHYMDASKVVRTLPSTFGFPDPVWEARKLLLERVTMWSRIYLPVLVRSFDDFHGWPIKDLAPLRPHVLVVPLIVGDHLKREFTEKTVLGCDLTIEREGKGVAMRYHVTPQQATPIVAAEFLAEVTAESEDLDVADYVPTFNPRRYDALKSRVFGERR